MTYKNSTGKYLITAILLFVVFLPLYFPLMASVTPCIATAADNYSAVLDDLHSDKAFDESSYTEDRTDYSVNVIQIAEGVHGNLFVYTYQPCRIIKSLVASKINMSLSESVDGTKLYDLKLISRDGVFCKYEVVGFTVAADETRYYNLSTIYRPWLDGVDAPATADKNVRNAVAYPVGQLWTAKNSGDTVKYEARELEVVTITSQMIGFRRYSDGFKFANTKICDAHYIAFTCDHDIDTLISADIDFVTTSYTNLKGSPIQYDAPTSQSVTLESYQVASNDGSGWFGNKEEWHRMISTSDFVDEVNITDKEKDVLLKYDWVLNFYETDYVCDAGGKDILFALLVPFGFIGTIVDSLTTHGTIVSDVTLLRLEFEYDGDIYDLGVVADTQTGDVEPTNKHEGFDLFDWIKSKIGANGEKWKLIGIAIIAVVVLIIVILLVALFKPAPREHSKKSRK